MNKYYILIWETTFIRMFETSSNSTYDIDINTLMTMCNNGINVENGHVENGHFKLYGNIKKYRLDNSIEKFVILSKTANNQYEVVNQHGQIKLLAKNDLKVFNSLNVKIVAYKTSGGTLDTKIVPYSGALETKSDNSLQQIDNNKAYYQSAKPSEEITSTSTSNTQNSKEYSSKVDNAYTSSKHQNRSLNSAKGIKDLMGVFKR